MMDRAPRVASLLPSATEIVCALGAGPRLVGVSHECDFPPGVEANPVLTRARLRPLPSSRAIDAEVRSVVEDALAVYEVEIEMWDTAQRFEPGHRISLQVASSAHPKYAVNLGTEGDQTTQTDGVIARNTLFHDSARPSRLLLTIAESAG